MVWHRQKFFRTVTIVTCHRNSVIIVDERIKGKCADDCSTIIIQLLSACGQCWGGGGQRIGESRGIGESRLFTRNVNNTNRCLILLQHILDQYENCKHLRFFTHCHQLVTGETILLMICVDVIGNEEQISWKATTKAQPKNDQIQSNSHVLLGSFHNVTRVFLKPWGQYITNYSITLITF